jgi:proliferating cell nuclear antigen PCNA
MQARLSPASTWIKLIDCIKEQVGILLITAKREELCFESGSIIRGVECRGRLESSFFQGYSVAETCKIGIEAAALGRVMRLAQAEDSLELLYSGGEALRVLIEAENEVKKVEFDLKTAPELPEELPVQIETPLALVELPALEFSRLCKGLSHLADSVTIEVSRKDVKLVIAGDMGEGQVSLRGLQLRAVIAKEARCEVPLGVLVQFNRAAVLSDTVTIRLFEAAPVQLTYAWPYGVLSFFSA